MKCSIIKLFNCCIFAGTLLVSACNSGEKTENASAENTTAENTGSQSTPAQSAPPESAAPASGTDSTASSTTALAANVDIENGKKLYNTNCVACHQLSKDVLVGPGLAGITERHSQEWLIPWIKNSQKVIASGDKYAIEIFNKYNKVPMPSYENFSDDDIKSILAYIEKNQVK